jgi:hypothetical protein
MHGLSAAMVLTVVLSWMLPIIYMYIKRWVVIKYVLFLTMSVFLATRWMDSKVLGLDHVEFA